MSAGTPWAIRKESSRRGEGFELEVGGILTRHYPTYDAALAALERRGIVPPELTDLQRSELAGEDLRREDMPADLA